MPSYLNEMFNCWHVKWSYNKNILTFTPNSSSLYCLSINHFWTWTSEYYYGEHSFHSVIQIIWCYDMVVRLRAVCQIYLICSLNGGTRRISAVLVTVNCSRVLSKQWKPSPFCSLTEISSDIMLISKNIIHKLISFKKLLTSIYK